MDKSAALARSILFGGLDRKALAELSGLAHKRDLAKGEVLFLVGEQAAGLFIVVSGAIRAFRVNAQGREQTIHVERDGATLADVPVFDDGVYPATAVAEEPTAVLFLSKADVRDFMLRHPETALVALKLMAKRMRGHAELVDALALQQVGQRLARFFLDHCRDHGSRTASGVEFELALSNEELARQVGSVREVVSRTLSRLERDGLFTLADSPVHGKRRRVVVPDPAALSRYAGE